MPRQVRLTGEQLRSDRLALRLRQVLPDHSPSRLVGPLPGLVRLLLPLAQNVAVYVSWAYMAAEADGDFGSAPGAFKQGGAED